MVELRVIYCVGGSSFFDYLCRSLTAGNTFSSCRPIDSCDIGLQFILKAPQPACVCQPSITAERGPLAERIACPGCHRVIDIVDDHDRSGTAEYEAVLNLGRIRRNVQVAFLFVDFAMKLISCVNLRA